MISFFFKTNFYMKNVSAVTSKRPPKKCNFFTNWAFLNHFFVFPSINQLLSELLYILLYDCDEILIFSHFYAFCYCFCPFYRKKCVMFMCHKTGIFYAFLNSKSVLINSIILKCIPIFVSSIVLLFFYNPFVPSIWNGPLTLFDFDAFEFSKA